MILSNIFQPHELLAFEEAGYSIVVINGHEKFSKSIDIAGNVIRIMFESRRYLHINDIVRNLDFIGKEFTCEDLKKIEIQFSLQDLISRFIFEYNKNIPSVLTYNDSGEFVIKKTPYKIVKKARMVRFTENKFFLHEVSGFSPSRYRRTHEYRKVYQRIDEITELNIGEVFKKIKEEK